MKHEFTDTQLRLAVGDFLEGEAVDLGTSALGEFFWTQQVKALRKMLNALPEPTTDEWEQCRFEDVRDTDEHVRFEFSDGSIIQGKPHQRTRTDIELWTGYAITVVSLTISKKGKARIYRIPKKIVHPDPVEHPAIVVVEADCFKGQDPQVLVWTGGKYENDGWIFDEDDITEWHPIDPAKVVEDDR